MNNKDSYEAVLVKYGMTEEQVQEQVNIDDVIPELANVYKGKSKIHGIGLFSSRRVPIGNIVCPARIRDKRTLAGRWSNHEHNPNTKSVQIRDSFVLVATRLIEKGDEITVNYDQVIQVNIAATR